MGEPTEGGPKSEEELRALQAEFTAKQEEEQRQQAQAASDVSKREKLMREARNLQGQIGAGEVSYGTTDYKEAARIQEERYARAEEQAQFDTDQLTKIERVMMEARREGKTIAPQVLQEYRALLGVLNEGKQELVNAQIAKLEANPFVRERLKEEAEAFNEYIPEMNKQLDRMAQEVYGWVKKYEGDRYKEAHQEYVMELLKIFLKEAAENMGISACTTTDECEAVMGRLRVGIARGFENYHNLEQLKAQTIASEADGALQGLLLKKLIGRNSDIGEALGIAGYIHQRKLQAEERLVPPAEREDYVRMRSMSSDSMEDFPWRTLNYMRAYESGLKGRSQIDEILGEIGKMGRLDSEWGQRRGTRTEGPLMPRRIERNPTLAAKVNEEYQATKEKAAAISEKLLEEDKETRKKRIEELKIILPEVEKAVSEWEAAEVVLNERAPEQQIDDIGQAVQDIELTIKKTQGKLDELDKIRIPLVFGRGEALERREHTRQLLSQELAQAQARLAKVQARKEASDTIRELSTRKWGPEVKRLSYGNYVHLNDMREAARQLRQELQTLERGY